MSLEEAIRTIVRNEIRNVMDQLRAATGQGVLFPVSPAPPATPEPALPVTPPGFTSREAVRDREHFLLALASRPEGITPTEAVPEMKTFLKARGYKRKVNRNYLYQMLYKLHNRGSLLAEPNTDKGRGSVGHGRLPGEYVYHAPLKTEE